MFNFWMKTGEHYRDFTGAADAFMAACFQVTERERHKDSSAAETLTMQEHFELNARTAIFSLKQRANSENSKPLQSIIRIIERRMNNMFDR